MPYPAQSVQFGANPGTDPNVTPYTTSTVSVTTAATSIVAVPANGSPVWITNGATPIFLGSDNTVTSSGANVGLQLAANASVLVNYGGIFGTINQDKVGGVSGTVWGITNSGSSTVTFAQVTNYPGNE